MTGNVRLPALPALARAALSPPRARLGSASPQQPPSSAAFATKLRRRVLFRCTGGRAPRRLLAARPVARLPCCVRAVLARHFSCRVPSAVVVIDYSRPTDTRLFSAHRGVRAGRGATRFEPRRATGRTVCTLRPVTLFRARSDSEEARIGPAPPLYCHYTFVLALCLHHRH
ncbi:hypothetical protein MTO96_013884 [Rhipicephalus appendiculatus]